MSSYNNCDVQADPRAAWALIGYDRTFLTKNEELGECADNLLGLSGGLPSSWRLSTSMTRCREAPQAKDDSEVSKGVFVEYHRRLAPLDQERERANEEISDQRGDLFNHLNEVVVHPKKTEIL